jgi:hypothetical protein
MAASTNEVSEQEFLEELNIYFQEAAECAQFLYTYLSIHALSANEDIRRGLSEEPLFWGTLRGSLLTSIFIVLGRVFNAANQHGPIAFVCTLRKAQAVFSRQSLAVRKKKFFGDNAAGLEKCLAKIRIPGEKEFGRFERLAKGYTKQFNSAAYRKLRDKVFAHKMCTKSEKVTDLFSKTNIDDLQRMVSFLYQFHEAVKAAYDDGKPLRLRRARYSVTAMLEKPRGQQFAKSVSEDVTDSTRRVLSSIAKRSPRE